MLMALRSMGIASLLSVVGGQLITLPNQHLDIGAAHRGGCVGSFRYRLQQFHRCVAAR